MIPVVAIVGRPNTGKSTLFNRLVGSRRAIESHIPGTTRDRIYQKTEMQNIRVMLIDTGGLEFDAEGDIESDVQFQTKLAIDEADVVIFVIDARQDMTTLDFAAADMLRKASKPCVLVANKCDNGNVEEKSFNLYELGFDEPIMVSAIHSRGIEEIEYRVEKLLKEQELDKVQEVIPDDTIHIGFFGRPNVGKSSLVNAFLDEDRAIVSDIPGTTRDSTDSLIEYENHKFTLIDTAGLRRRGKIGKDLEYYSVLQCFKSLDRTDIALLIVDSTESISKQDMNVAHYILEEGKGLIVVINKSDVALQKKSDEKQFLEYMKRKFHFLPWAPMLFVSALTKKNIDVILERAKHIYGERKKRIQTAILNDFVTRVKYRHAPSSRTKGQPKILYASQVATDPPHFIFFVNDRDKFHFSYKRYLENRLRDEYGFEGTAIRVEFRNRTESRNRDSS